MPLAFLHNIVILVEIRVELIYNNVQKKGVNMSRRVRGKRKRISFEAFLFIFLIIVVTIVFIFLHKNKDNNVVQTSTSNIINVDENTFDDSEKEEKAVIEEKNEVIQEANTIDLTKLSESEKMGNEGLPIIMYHFFYDKSKGETAKDGNWLEVSVFEDHLKYLTENNYYFPTWEQVADFVEGKGNLPKKSIVLTVDDGEDSFFDVALPIVKKYDVKVTEFLVTSWNGWYKNDYPAKQMTYQSHSHDMHKGGANGKGAIVNWSYSEILEDLKWSRGVLGDECIAFCYPFGHYNDTAKKAVKEAGYRVAVTTEGGRAKKGNDPYALPRVRTSSGTTLEIFKGLVE